MKWFLYDRDVLHERVSYYKNILVLLFLAAIILFRGNAQGILNQMKAAECNYNPGVSWKTRAKMLC